LFAEDGRHQSGNLFERDPGGELGGERVEQVVTGFGEAAAEHDHIRVEQRDRGQQAVGERRDRVVPHSSRRGVAGGCAAGDVGGGDGVAGGFLVAGGDGLRGGLRFQASAPAAPALAATGAYHH